MIKFAVWIQLTKFRLAYSDMKQKRKISIVLSIYPMEGTALDVRHIKWIGYTKMDSFLKG